MESGQLAGPHSKPNPVESGECDMEPAHSGMEQSQGGTGNGELEGLMVALRESQSECARLRGLVADFQREFDSEDPAPLVSGPCGQVSVM